MKKGDRIKCVDIKSTILPSLFVVVLSKTLLEGGIYIVYDFDKDFVFLSKEDHKQGIGYYKTRFIVCTREDKLKRILNENR